MWKVLVIVLPLVLGSCKATGPLEAVVEEETINTEEQRYKHLLYQIHGTVQKLLDEHQKHVDQRLDTLTQLVETACTSGATSQTNDQVDFAEIEPKIEELSNVFFTRLTATGEKFVAEVQSKLKDVTSETVGYITLQLLTVASKQDVAVLQHQLSNLATSEALSDLRVSLTSFAATATEEVKQAISSVASERDASNQKVVTQNEMSEIRQQLDVIASCNHMQDFDQVLTLLASTERDIDGLAEIMRTSLAEQRSTCVSGDEHRQRTDSLVQLIEGLQASVDANANGIRGVESAVGKMDGEVAVRLAALQELAQDINNNTLHPPPPPPPTTTTTTTPRPTTTTTAPKVATPCLDSSFTGFGNFDVCGSAVRFRKCKALFMSYHCCRTCTDAGMIPVMGPHRYLQASRSVPIIQALDFF
ncbi:uncharacterized protein LOC122258901 [Penaeus japonicus]|uniref:uncharacterized protein LOC122258901 n=1 Tax=Penaeus japonicus TaxID=27405 RepID=UPI001C70B995|nr:uncharacterized protein LOC122258901 [Penaeus japonicus]